MPYRVEPFRAGEYYHLYNRGSNYQDIFFERDNYRHFMRLIRQHLLSGLNLIAYCLMPNHYHLLVRLLNDDLSHNMQAFVLAYTKAINKRYDRVGPLFQGRFQAIRIDRDEYLLHLSRYIHWNPVAAGLVQRPEDWEFSSYRDYIGLHHETLLQMNIVLDQFSSPSDYRAFVEMDQINQPQTIKHLVLE